MTYDEAQKRLFAEFQVKASKSSLCGFFHRAKTMSLQFPAPTVTVDTTQNESDRTITVVIQIPN